MPKSKKLKSIPHTNLDHIKMVEDTLAKRSGPSSGVPGTDKDRIARAKRNGHPFG